jgi:hypothetical protein
MARTPPGKGMATKVGEEGVGAPRLEARLTKSVEVGAARWLHDRLL